MRGEHVGLALFPRFVKGSSPHARGTHTTATPSFRRVGIIPACAGNTDMRTSRWRRRGDHPRMRGEHNVAAILRAIIQGSSPHARGTPFVGSKSSARAGIIPACAGNTDIESGCLMELRDHPRMRGEHQVRGCASSPGPGSSPHARGTHGAGRRVRGCPGIIPACAGNTWARTSPADDDRDHPRMRGEHMMYYHLLEELAGSSPHARGTPGRILRTGRGAGIIPACAGNTLCMFRHPR